MLGLRASSEDFIDVRTEKEELRRMEAEIREGDNEYHSLHMACRAEMGSFGWLTQDGNIDLPAGRDEGYLQVLGSYMDNVITPLRRLYAWSVPSEHALDLIRDASPGGVCEIGSGTGYWAMLLRRKGVSVAAYDR